MKDCGLTIPIFITADVPIESHSTFNIKDATKIIFPACFWQKQWTEKQCALYTSENVDN